MPMPLNSSNGRLATIVDLLRQRALHRPDVQGYIFLADGELDEAPMTYRELDGQARVIAAQLQELQAQGQRVLLLYQPGLDYIAAFFGCLYAGAIAVPAYPPDPFRLERTLPRFQAMLHDARPVIVLTTASILTMAAPLIEELPGLRDVRWLATDTLPGELAAAWREPALSADSVAFLQYTSGSTASPKGVIISHGNLLHNSAQICRYFGNSEASQGVVWLPPYHDMGLIGGILQPLYAGFPMVLLSPGAFLQRPLRWLQAVSRYKATTSGGPNFAYDLCARKITAEQRASLDLSSWAVAFNGAEPIRHETLVRFSELFGPCGFRATAFYPCYGLAEATLIVSGGLSTAAPISASVQADALQRGEALAAPDTSTTALTLVGCGQALGDQQIRIVDPETATVCPPGQIGEIWVAGPSVAMGYWGRPEESAQTFRAALPEGGQYLRTGDLGFLQDDELFVTGRRKDLIIINGLNHYPQDLELTVEQSHPALRPGCCAVFAVQSDGLDQLVIVAEVGQPKGQPQDKQAHAGPGAQGHDVAGLDGEELTKTIRRAVAQHHDLQVGSVVLLKPGSIPKTSSGKLQHQACRASFLAGTLDAVGG